MQIQVDTREHNKEWERIKGQFDALGVQYFRSKCYVGDYVSLDNPRLAIDRKREMCTSGAIPASIRYGGKRSTVSV